MRHRARELRRREGRGRDRGLRDPPGGTRALSFVCLIEIHLHFPDNGSLKGKRKELQSLKAQLHRRFGASVAETDHHDLWQRSTVTAALVGGEARVVEDAAMKLERYVESQFPQGVRLERGLISAEELLG